MQNPVIELLQEEPNGISTVFHTSAPYLMATLVIFHNGFAIVSTADNGYNLLGGNSVQFKIAPRVKDVVQAYYVPVL